MTNPTSSPATSRRTGIVTSILALMSGQDSQSLSIARGDQRFWAFQVPIAVFFGLLIHGLGFAVSAWTLGHDPSVVWPVLAIPCLALALMDWRTASMREYARAADTAVTMRPDLNGLLAGSRIANILRWAPQILVGLLLGIFMSLAIMKEDTLTRIAKWNQEEVALSEKRHMGTFSARRNLLETRLTEARARLANAKALDPREAQNEERKDALAGLRSARAEVARLDADITAFKVLAEQARERAECERLGEVTERCPNATGESGEGSAFASAIEAETEANQAILDLEVALSAKQAEVRALEGKIPPAAAQALPAAIERALKEVVEAENSLLEFNPATELAQRVDEDPARRTYNQDALADQLRALKVLLEEDPALLGLFLLTKAVMVALECLVPLMCAGSRHAEYQFKRAVSVTLEIDAARRVVEDSYLTNQARHREFGKQVMHDDAKVVQLRRDLARTSAEQAAKDLAASEHVYTEHLVRGARETGIAAE